MRSQDTDSSYCADFEEAVVWIARLIRFLHSFEHGWRKEHSTVGRHDNVLVPVLLLDWLDVLVVDAVHSLGVSQTLQHGAGSSAPSRATPLVAPCDDADDPGSDAARHSRSSCAFNFRFNPRRGGCRVRQRALSEGRADEIDWRRVLARPRSFGRSTSAPKPPRPYSIGPRGGPASEEPRANRAIPSCHRG